MIELREIEFRHLVSGLTGDGNEPCARAFFLSGIFGSGKSEMIRSIKQALLDSGRYDAMFEVTNVKELSFLPELLGKFSLFPEGNFNLTDKRSLEEVIYNHNKYIKLLEFINDSAPHAIPLMMRAPFSLTSSAEPVTIERLADEGCSGDLCAEMNNGFSPDEFGNLAAEAFILDMLRLFMPLGHDAGSYADYLVQGAKKRVLISIDNYDVSSFAIDFWLGTSFFKYCFNSRFSDFKYYDIPNMPAGAKVSDLLDFRFLLGRRASRYPVDYFDASVRGMVEEIELKTLNAEELKALFNAGGTDVGEDIDEILRVTSGIPLLVALISESISLGEGWNVDARVISKYASGRILCNLTEKEQDWVKCASFLDEFDGNGLRCFPFIGADHKEALRFFEKASELTTRDASGKPALRPIIKKFVQSAVSIDSPATANQLNMIAANYYAATEYINDLSESELNLLVFLSQLEEPFEEGFLDFLFEAEHLGDFPAFRENFPDYFVKDGTKIDLKDETRTTISLYVKYGDLLSDRIKSALHSIASRTQDYITTKIDGKKIEIEQLEASLAECEEIKKSIIKKANELKARTIEHEAKISDTKRTYESELQRIKLVSPNKLFIFAAILIILSYLYDNLVNPGNNDNVGKILYYTSLLSFAGTFAFILKNMMARRSMHNLENVKQMLGDLSSAREGSIKEMNELRKNEKTTTGRMDVLKQNIIDEKNNLEYLMKLSDNY